MTADKGRNIAGFQAVRQTTFDITQIKKGGNMKKLSVVLLLLFLPSIMVAQVEKGRIIIDVDFHNLSHKSTVKYDGAEVAKDTYKEIDTNLRLGYTIINNLEIGVILDFVREEDSLENGADIDKRFGYGLFTRYYFLSKKKIKPFVEASFALHDMDVKHPSTGSDFDTDGHSYAYGIGVACFLNNNIGIEVIYKRYDAVMTFSHDDKIELHSKYSTFSFGIIGSFDFP